MTTTHAPAAPGASGALAGAATRATDVRQLDQMVTRLQTAAPTFARLPLGERISLARSMQAGYLRIARASVEAACAAKGLRPDSPAAGEEWATGPLPVVRQLRLVIESLRSIQRTGTTPVGPLGRTFDGRLTARVFPGSRLDGVLFAGMTVDVHLQPGETKQTLDSTRASFYRDGRHGGRVVLVLGAGNITAIPAMDVITKLFNEGSVCLLKINPVNAYLGPLVEEAFVEAIARGYLAVAYGGAEEGAHLVRHQGIDQIHLTGSAETYDTIMWGPPGPAREARKARNEPLVAKPVTAELGNVTPVLVVPGPYSDRELAFQAESIAGAVTWNASFLCNSAKMLVTPRGWSLGPALLAAVERSLEAIPPRMAYYPGAEQRWRRLIAGRTGLSTLGAAGTGKLPWTLLPGLDATDAGEPAFTTEPFCAVLSSTEVGSDDPVEFLDRVVEFANRRLWGTLAADVVVHPKSLKDSRVADALERAIGRLRYGTVAVNTWNGFSFGFAAPPWGAYPGSSPADIQSGTGWVHDTAMLERVEKVVLRHPLTIVPKPAHFPSHRTAHTLLPRLTALEQRGAWSKAPGVIVAAMRG